MRFSSVISRLSRSFASSLPPSYQRLSPQQLEGNFIILRRISPIKGTYGKLLFKIAGGTGFILLAGACGKTVCSSVSEPNLPLDLLPEELRTVSLFHENTPAVVNIATLALIPKGHFSMDVWKIPRGQGSGFVWDNQGHIVTNFHVVQGASELQISLSDQSVWKARVIGGDRAKDVAVLQIEAPKEAVDKLKPITLGQSSNLLVGQRVYAIGNPFGLDHTLTSGIISGLNRELTTELGNTLRNVIQTDAAINPGNSGGPLLDSRGRLVGINTAIADPSGGGSNVGVGFAIPIDAVKGLVEQILKFGRVIRPALGISIAPRQALQALGLEGVLVLHAPPDSPAYQAGMRGVSPAQRGRMVLGDVIVGLNNRPVKSEADLFDVLDGCHVGDMVEVVVLRVGSSQVKKLKVVLGERMQQSQAE